MLALPSMASLCFFRTMALNIEGGGGGEQDDPVMGNLLLSSKDEIAILHVDVVCLQNIRFPLKRRRSSAQCVLCTVISVNMPNPHFYRKYAPPFSEGSFLKILW